MSKENYRILIAPLNWGLGHSTRSAGLVDRLLQGDAQLGVPPHPKIVLAGDGESGKWLHQHYPQYRYIPLPELRLHYWRHGSQIPCLMMQAPKILRWIIRDHRALKRIVETEHFDLIISDNRFGFFTNKTRCVYMTHQLVVPVRIQPHWFEHITSACHRLFWRQYDEVWVPDYDARLTVDGARLAGRLSTSAAHQAVGSSSSYAAQQAQPITYIGPLSRLVKWKDVAPDKRYETVVIKSLSLLRKENGERRMENGELIISPQMGVSDEQLVAYMKGAKRIVAHSGYSTIMDLTLLGLMDKAQLTPTPGQVEQEYLKFVNRC